MNVYNIARVRAVNGSEPESLERTDLYVVFDPRVLFYRASRACAALDAIPAEVCPYDARYPLEASAWATESSIREWLRADCPPSLEGSGTGRKWRPSEVYTEKSLGALEEIEERSGPSDISRAWWELCPRTEVVRIACMRGVSWGLWDTPDMFFRSPVNIHAPETEEDSQVEGPTEFLSRLVNEICDRRIQEVLRKVQETEAQMAELKRSKT